MYLRMGKAMLALILVMLTAFLLPVQVLAQTVDAADGTLSGEVEAEPYTVGNILCEVESERDEHIKRFRLDDGSYMAVSYEQPVHYKDEDGNWVDYDNSLVSETDNSATNDEASFNEYTNKQSNIKVNYSKKSKACNMVKIKANDYMVSWGYENTNKVEGVIVANDDKLEGNEKFTALKNLNSQIVYEDVYDNVDIQYITNSVGIKENIILKSKDTPSDFTIEYKINKLTATAKSDKLIELSDKEGKVVYSIEAPYMVDAEGKTSTQLSLSIVEQKNSKLTLQISADKEFLAESTYPVTIDPSFTTSQDWGACDCTYVDTSNPNTAFGSQVAEVSVGYYGVGRYRTYMKVNTLPTLNEGDMVVGAYLNMHLKYNDFYQDMSVGAHFVEGSWTESGLTWNNQPSHESNVIDYETFVANDPNAWHDWDVTECVKRWYSGESNNGILLKPINGSNEVQCATFYSGNTASATPRPLFEIVYRNNKGLEEYWTYSSFQVGTAGTVYVNDYSGNLVFVENDATMPTGYSPASVQHIFNSYMAGEKYDKTKPYVGAGWRLNIQQTVYPSSEYGLDEDAQKIYPYVYTDGDGTEHYFYDKTPATKTSSEKYYDEDGLGLTLTVNADDIEKYKIADDKNNRYIFYDNGLLSSIIDSNDNNTEINFGSNEKVIDYVSDMNGNIIDLTMSNNFLSKIDDVNDRSKIYSYESERLTQIERPGGTKVNFTYNDRGLIKTITDIDGYKVVFTYTSASNGSKVATITEQGTDGTNGQVITFDRTKYNTTIVNTYGADGVSGTNDELTSTYQFDEWGRTISIKSNTVTKDLGATAYSYTDGEVNSTASNIKQLNKVSTQYGTGSNVVNLINNPSFESTSNWTDTSWLGTNTHTTSYVTSEQYFGKKSLKVNVTAYESDSRARIYQDLSNDIVKQGKTYTISGYIKAGSLSSKASNLSGAFIGVQSHNSDGTYTYFNSDLISSTTGSTVNKGWQRVTKTFTVPENSNKVRISLLLRSAVGTVYFDGIQLEEYNVANNFNLLENADFENFASTGLPTSWVDENSNLDTSTDTKNTTYTHRGDSSFKISGSCTLEKGLKQTVDIAGTENDTYIVSGWARANAIANNEDDERKFRIALRVKYTDGEEAVKKAAEFNYSVSDWQYTSTAFNLSDLDDSTQRTPSQITVMLRYHNQCNNVYFDNISLIKDATQSYTYDADGNVTSVVANAQKQSALEYENTDLVKDTDAKGYAYEYDYDSNHNMTKATSQRGVESAYSYNDMGLATTLTIGQGDGYKIKTSAAYNDNGLVRKVIDSVGNVATYEYNDYTGTLASTTDNSGTTTYTYNENTDALKSVAKGNSSVSYLYTPGSKLLQKITHNGTDYKITYDEYGNRTESKVGTQTLASYTYNSNNGALIKSTYGNGNKVSWTYDMYGNKSVQKYNGTTAFKWWSDRSGNVVREQDLINNIQYDSSYDTTGRPVRVMVKEADATYAENGLLYKIGYNYDLNNNITDIAFNTPLSGTSNRVVNSGYTYIQDNLLKRFDINSTRYVNYIYDDLNRLTRTAIRTESESDKKIVTTYEYHNDDRADGYTSNRIEFETIDGVMYRYKYDNSGNVSEIYKFPDGSTGNLVYKYNYDSLNQLTSYTDYENSKTYTYTYDVGGNISKEVVTNTSTGSTTTNTYSYTDTNWTDKLTSYNGTTITYDAIGNPLSYRDGITMTWKNGRQLATLQDSDNSVSYTYDSNNVRVSKTVDGVKHTYAYVNGLLRYETRGSKRFWYSYDANGVLYSVRYTLTDSGALNTYYFTHNSRGDIVGIYDTSANLVAKYEYDAWGKVLSVTNASGTAITSATHIGNLNPFRYRGYFYDNESGLYYLMSRYYDPVTHRFVNADAQLNISEGVSGYNLFQYCGNNAVNRLDPTGQAWWHWAIGAAVVVGCAAATVITCGGFAAAAGAVAAVGSGVAASTTASTIAAGAFIGSATVYGMAVASAASTSSSVKEFNDKGNWGTVTATVGGAVVGGAGASFLPSGSSSNTVYPPNNGFNATPRESIIAPGSHLQRIGGTSGSFVAPINTSPSSLSLPPDKIGASVMNLEVLQPISVQAGTAVPWFGQSGGGTQFLLPDSVQNLIANGSLRIMP